MAWRYIYHGMEDIYYGMEDFYHGMKGYLSWKLFDNIGDRRLWANITSNFIQYKYHLVKVTAKKKKFN